MPSLQIRWHVLRSGDPAGVPILFLHGFMERGDAWRATMRQLPAGVCAVAPDLPGHGRTTADLDRLDFETLSAAIIKLAKDSFASPPVLVGYSMGGRIALYTALASPADLSGLVLVSTTAGIGHSSERARRRRADQETADALRRDDLQSFLRRWYEQPVFASLRNRPDLVDSLVRDKFDNDPLALAEIVTRLSPGRQPSLWDNLHRWDKPALIIAGRLDARYCEIARRMAARMKNARSEIIPGAGHIVHRENNKEFVSVLNFFLSAYML